MLKLERDAATTFIATTTELKTITNPEYLFAFENEQTNEFVYCVLNDVSLYPTRYNEFTITDGTDLDFPIDGYYTYSIYEQATGSGNLDPTGLTLVEKGRAYVYKTDTAPNEYDNTNDIDTIYEPE